MGVEQLPQLNSGFDLEEIRDLYRLETLGREYTRSELERWVKLRRKWNPISALGAAIGMVDQLRKKK